MKDSLGHRVCRWLFFLCLGLLGLMTAAQLLFFAIGFRFHKWVYLLAVVLVCIILALAFYLLYHRDQKQPGFRLLPFLCSIVCIVLGLTGFVLFSLYVLWMPSGGVELLDGREVIAFFTFGDGWMNPATEIAVYEKQNFIWCGPYVGDFMGAF